MKDRPSNPHGTIFAMERYWNAVIRHHDRLFCVRRPVQHVSSDANPLLVAAGRRWRRIPLIAVALLRREFGHRDIHRRKSPAAATRPKDRDDPNPDRKNGV